MKYNVPVLGCHSESGAAAARTGCAPWVHFTVTPPMEMESTMSESLRVGAPNQDIGTSGKVRLRELGQECGFEFFLGKGGNAVVIGHFVFALGALHALEIGQIIDPNVAGVVGLPAGGREKGSQDRLVLIQDRHSVGFAYGGGDFCAVVVCVLTPGGLGIFFGFISLAAVDVIADVSIGMVGYRSVFHFIERFCPAATAWALRASSSKEAGISARSTPCT